MMKTTVLDVLMYLLERHQETEESPLDLDGVKQELREQGVDEAQVDRAFDWLEDLAVPDRGVPPEDAVAPAGPGAIRCFTKRELIRLDAECRGFLIYLENAHVLGPRERELVLERVMALDAEELSLAQLKWVVLMVLCNQPGREEAVVWVEQLLPEEREPCFH
jgi:Smg protein